MLHTLGQNLKKQTKNIPAEGKGTQRKIKENAKKIDVKVKYNYCFTK